MSTLLPLVLHQQRGGAEVDDGTRTQYADYAIGVSWGLGIDGGAAEYNDLVGQAGHGVKSVKITRGRDDVLASMVAGTATIVLHDPDGLYNPLNPSSPLASYLLPMRRIYVAADNGGDLEYLITGFIRSIEHNPEVGYRETTIEVVDQFVGLDQAHPVIAYPTTTDDVGSVLTVVGDLTGAGVFTYASAGSTVYIPNSWADGTKSGLTLIEELLAADRGVIYCAKEGGLVYEASATRTGKSSVATITDTMRALRPGVDLDRIGNRAYVTRTGGEQQFAEDTASQDLYGIRDIGSIESPHLADDTAAADLAEYLVDQFKDPRSPMFALEQMNRDADTMTQIIERELQDRITVVDTLGGTSGDYHIEAIEHEITEGGKWHRCKWILSARGTGTQTGHAGAVGVVTPGVTPVPYIPEGDTLPDAPKGGETIFYVADESDGVVWQFRYDDTAGHWRFVGGPPLYARIDTDQSTTSGSYTNLASTGPTVTVPLAGKYIVRVGCNTYNSGVATNLMSYQIAAGAASDRGSQAAIAASGYSASLSDEDDHTGVAASSAITAKYRTTAGTANFRYRWIAVTPVTVTI